MEISGPRSGFAYIELLGRSSGVNAQIQTRFNRQLCPAMRTLDETARDWAGADQILDLMPRLFAALGAVNFCCCVVGCHCSLRPGRRPNNSMQANPLRGSPDFRR